MIDPSSPFEPWAIRESELDLDAIAQMESVFALANGHIGLRANLDEGEPNGLPGTYLNGFYEEYPMPYAEPGYGYPELGETVLNVTDGKIMRLLVDDQPFDVRFGDLLHHERVLDLRAGVLRRNVEWLSPAAHNVRVSSIRLVSFAQRAIAALQYEVEVLDRPASIVVQSELVANEPMPSRQGDPRVAADLGSPLRAERVASYDGERAVLVHSTARSGLCMAAAMAHQVEGPEGTETTTAAADDDLASVTVRCVLEPGQRLSVVKFLAYGWSSRRSTAALADQVMAALVGAQHEGWEGLLAAQRAYLDDFWRRADVEIEGDAELQQAVRFALFHTLQAGARSEQRAIAAKGLTGSGYDGHTFWDTEAFVLPVLTYTTPHAARDALRWRHSTLELARSSAEHLGLRGVAFPWRTIAGRQSSGYWPAGTAAFHVNAAIADAVGRYQAAVDDPRFERETGLELLVGTARLWSSLGHRDQRGDFRIDGVTGPDEYSAIADNNVYTNLMAQRNLRMAADAVTRHRKRAEKLGVDEEEVAAWRDAAEAMFVPYDEALGIHPQADSFLSHERWDFEHTSPGQYPLLLHFPYFDLYRKQVVKQADLVLALHLCGDAFSDAEKARNFAYYEPLTVRDSSLSACTQAVVAAEVGHLELAYDYFRETALIDLQNLHDNTSDGLHIGSLAGAWIVAVSGFGGMRDHGGTLTFAPRLPERLTRIAFGLCFRGRELRVEVEREEARYRLLSGKPLEIRHHGQRLEVAEERTETRPIAQLPAREPPSQPPGRAPRRRG